MDWEINALSRREIASLTEPSDVLAINRIASSEIFPFSFVDIFFNLAKTYENLINKDAWG